MPRPSFLTVPVELVEHAEAAYRYFKGRGYRVSIEYWDLGFPSRPTLVCTRGDTTIYVEVNGKISLPRLSDWTRYCASCNSDSQVAVCVPTDARLSARDLIELQTLKVGLYFATAESVVERFAPADLALKVSLPEHATLPMPVRKALGPIYEQFERNQWRDGFRDATQVVEQHARRYLKHGIRSTRIVVLDKAGKVRPLSNGQIDKMTLGALAVAFANIRTPSQRDSIIAQALTRVNPDRVKVSHFKGKRGTEKKLRENVGRHMWSLVAALKELLKR